MAFVTARRCLALSAAGAIALSACSVSMTASTEATAGTQAVNDGTVLTIGSLLPLTGSHAFAGGAQVAGIHLAVDEINANGGIFDHPVKVIDRNSADATQPQIAEQSIEDFVAGGVSVVVGATAPYVSSTVMDAVVAAQMLMVSPADGVAAPSAVNSAYFSLAASNEAQARALALAIQQAGYASVGMIALNDADSIAMRDALRSALDSLGIGVTYGVEGQEVDPLAQSYAPQVGELLASGPAAVVVIMANQTPQVITALVDNAFPMAALFLVAANTVDYSTQLEPGILAGAHGVMPGAAVPTDFAKRLETTNGGALGSYTYGPEAYDAVMLTALAALRGGSTDGPTIRTNLLAVSGAAGGTACSGWVECATLLRAGSEIAYQGIAATGPLNSVNGPTSAAVGIYRYADANLPVRDSTGG